MECIIITIGNEILSGRTVDTNASYISQRLFFLGIYVKRIITIPDVKDEIETTLKNALKEVDLVVTTGGLGPTRDDITKKTIAKIFDRELIIDGDILRSVEERFRRFGYAKMPESNISQAEVPEGAFAFPNRRGTAPGIIIREEQKTCVLLPGVPFEMEGLMDEFIIPYLKKNLVTDTVIVVGNIRTTGIGESSLAELLEPSLKETGKIELAYLPGYSGVDLRLTARGKDRDLLNNKIKEIEEVIRDKAAEYIYGYGDEDLARIVFEILKKKKYSLSVAESCTGGLISHRLTNIPGSSAVFIHGAVTYSKKAKMDILKVPGKILKKHGAVSMETALAMAEGIRRISGSDIGLSTTGIAGPDKDEFNNPVGLVYAGYSDESGSEGRKFMLGEGRLMVKERAAQAALNLLRIKLND